MDKVEITVPALGLFLNLLAYFRVTSSYAFIEGKTSSVLPCAAYHPSDVLCNNGTNNVDGDDSRTFACVCYAADFSLSSTYPGCYSLVITETLPALRLILASKNGFGTLESLSKQTVPLGRSRISYEYYLKRKISNIFSTYCNENDHNCKSIGRTIHPSNVIILRLSCVEEDPHQFMLDYTIVKTTQQHNLTETSVIEPGLILAALQPKLQKTIPYTIINHEPLLLVPFPIDSDSIDDEGRLGKLWNDNIGLVTALIVIAALVAIIYIIAILKAIR
jgi:hypothetical protein